MLHWTSCPKFFVGMEASGEKGRGFAIKKKKAGDLARADCRADARTWVSHLGGRLGGRATPRRSTETTTRVEKDRGPAVDVENARNLAIAERQVDARAFFSTFCGSVLWTCGRLRCFTETTTSGRREDDARVLFSTLVGQSQRTWSRRVRVTPSSTRPSPYGHVRMQDWPSAAQEHGV